MFQMPEQPHHASLQHLWHRPWPLPDAPWSWRQVWRNLLFAHWEADAASVAARLPAGLELDTFQGRAWIGLVPFTMHGIARRPLPPVPGFSAFPELNVRTYVRCHGRPGVWFFSLDITNPLAVWVARKFFHLPYRLARMSCTTAQDGYIRYSSRCGEQALEATYRPLAEGAPDDPEGFISWSTERYCLYAADKQGGIYRGDIHHRKWPLTLATLHIAHNTLLDGFGCSAMRKEVVFCPAIEVVVWAPQKII